MATTTIAGSDTGKLLEAIVDDVGRLLEQQLQLLRSDLGQEVGKVQKAALSLGGGAGLVGVAGILGTLTVVHLLHDITRLPLWVCYGLVGGLVGAAGAKMLSCGVAEIRDIQFLPERTAETLRQDVAAVAHPVRGASA